MGFDLKKFFQAIFDPQPGEIVTIMIDLPHDDIKDNGPWKSRRRMAAKWHRKLSDLAPAFQITVSPLLTYMATGSHNSDIPQDGLLGNDKKSLAEVILNSTIVLAMPEYSATAPLFLLTKKSPRLRVGSMPRVARFMEKTGLSADYNKVADRCRKAAAIFDQSIAAEVEFSTGHRCYFDLPLQNKAHRDDGILHPSKAGTDGALSNLPAGEVYCVPNENPDSRTSGELPEKTKNEIIVYVVKNNRIVDVIGKSAHAASLREKFKDDPAWQNIAEFALGLNDKAKVTGNVLEDEKAGFHWAYGRSDHFGGKIGVASFKTPANVIHQDIVYARKSPIYCRRLVMIGPDGTRTVLIDDGELQI